ncbi:unnamed protein product [Fusarium fujikuroi]|uniref:Uncharacterized protein n=1 Tax=Fusarium fujikuroi TaxID=5127 RepID=A0A9Q9UET0_FUSFU|nr:unnamed protein product [Fusarium fujikuroi]
MVLSPLQSGSFNFVSDSFQHDTYRVGFALRLLKLFSGGVQPPQCEISSNRRKINVVAENAAGHPITPNRGRDDDPAANVTTTPNRAVDREPPTSLESTRVFLQIELNWESHVDQRPQGLTMKQRKRIS